MECKWSSCRPKKRISARIPKQVFSRRPLSSRNKMQTSPTRLARRRCFEQLWHFLEPRRKSRIFRDGDACQEKSQHKTKNQDEKTQSFEKLAKTEGRILTLDFGNFFLINVYTPNSKPDLSRLPLRETTWDPEYKNLLKKLEKEKPVITCGDFNVANEEIDLARPKTNHKNAGFTNEERQGIKNLINSGFLDTFRFLHPEEIRYTWWSHWGKARENNVGWRIDYFFISKSLEKNLLSAEIYEASLGSDHCPISITLEI